MVYTKRNMLSFRNRFHGHGSLRYVYKNGQAIRSHLVTLKFSQHPKRKQQRVAVVISKKVIKGAVGRNRVRRRVYEIIRHELPKIKDAQDLVFLVFSSEVATMPHDELVSAIKGLLAQGNLYRER